MKKIFYIILVVIGIFVVYILGNFVWNKMFYESAVVKNKTYQGYGEVGKTADWKIYKNSEYGFELTLTDAWKGYKVFQRNDVAIVDRKYLDFAVPTSNKNLNIFGSSNSNGYAAPFGIAVYPKAEWTKVVQEHEQEGSPIPFKITEDSRYVFAYYHWQDSPSDLDNIDFGISQILASFKLNVQK